MIVEMRTYTLQIGAVPEYLKLYEGEGLPIARPILGNLLGYFHSEFGTLNQVIHLWGYADLNDRAKRRAELSAQPAWHAYLKKSRPYMTNQETRILNCAPFSPIK